MVLIGSSGKFEHAAASLHHVYKHKEVVSCEDAAGDGACIAFSHSSWNNYIYHFDGGL